MKTSTQIIEEFDKLNIQFSAYGYIVQLPDSEVERIKSFMLKAMKTAVDEVTPEKEKCDHSEWQECGCLDYNDAIDDLEEKKRKFFEE